MILGFNLDKLAACVNANVRGQFSNLLFSEQTDAETQICCYMF